MTNCLWSYSWKNSQILEKYTRVTRKRLTEIWPVAEGDENRIKWQRLLNSFFVHSQIYFATIWKEFVRKNRRKTVLQKIPNSAEKSSRAVGELCIVTRTLLYSKAVIAVGDCGGRSLTEVREVPHLPDALPTSSENRREIEKWKLCVSLTGYYILFVYIVRANRIIFLQKKLIL